MDEMDENDTNTVDLAASKPLPPSSSDDTIDEFEEEQRQGSRPTTSYRVSENNADDALPPTNQNNQDAPTPKRPTSSQPQTVLRADAVPTLRPPRTLQLPAQGQQRGYPGDPDISYAAGLSPLRDHEHEHNDSYTAQMVRRNLQDFESSFTTPISPLPTVETLVPDDTFIFDSPSRLPRSPLSSHRSYNDEASPSPTSQQNKGEITSPEPKKEASSDHSNLFGGTSALETFSSPPTGADTATGISRAMSMLSIAKDGPGNGSGASLGVRDNIPRSNPSTHGSFLQRDDAPGASGTSSNGNSNGSIPKISVDAGSAPNHALKGENKPRYLRSRMGSEWSSSSSFTAEDDSNATTGTGVGLGVDYGVQSGGAISAMDTSRNSSTSNLMTRQISMGSMASDFREDSTGRIGVEPLEPLDEFGGVASDNTTDERLRTPKAPRQPLTEPTDTAIARHVRNVHVPESLAREYRTKSGFATPMRKLSEINLNLGASASTTRTGRNLTLKEQSSTIERLSKENFDLKLKVMFLSDRLDKLSEEGIKEMISENVELKTSVAVLQRDNKVLRRRVKELEKKSKDDDERPSTAKSGASSGPTADDYAAQANEEELVYLRERVEEFVTEIERLREENMNKEAEKRRMAEMVKNLQTLNESRVGESLGHDDETEVWKELYSQETARREQADEDNKRLGDENRNMRDEIFRLKQDLASSTKTPGGPPSSTSHTTNIYNITKKPRNQSPSRPQTRMSEAETMNGAVSVSTSFVEELRRESEQLRHENAELRREVGAQTSMLTSRNREKERLYQEIEDLKMAARRGGPTPSTADSILERSASRSGVHDRPPSRGSGMTRTATLDEDPEREELENKLFELRDKFSGVKMQNQDLQQELSNYAREYEIEAEGRKHAEMMAQQLQEELELTRNDLVTLQQERDELLQENSGLDQEFGALQAEAQDEIDHLEAEAEQSEQEIARLNQELAERNENQEALQEEMRRLSEDMIRFEDTQETQLRRIKQLEEELTEANKELDELESKLIEANDKAQRLGIQLESTQGEISFLREEQEGDKLRIGDLVGQVANLESSVREEKDKVKELEHQIQAERQQREVVANQEKEEVQQVVDNLNREISAGRDEARKLRKNLSKQEVEAAEWKERLLELENNLREALDDANGTRSSFLRGISKLQRDLDATCRDLDSTRASLNEKDHLLKQRDELLETTALESRRLAEVLAKEQQLHRNTKNQVETLQKTQMHVHGNMSSAELRIKELEAAKSQDKQRLAKLESTLKEQLNERNSLLLVLWTRLSSLCGTDWAHDNSLISGRALPSLEAVATMLPGFSKNLLAAVRTIEGIVSKFKDRVKSVERELWREYQHVEETLERRIKKLDKIEALVRNGVATGDLNIGGQLSNALLEEQKQRMTKLEDAYRQLKIDNTTLRTANEVRARQVQDAMLDPRMESGYDAGSPSPSIPTGPTGSTKSGEKDSQRTRSRQSSNNLGITRTTSSSSSNHRPATISRTSTLTRERSNQSRMTGTTGIGSDNDAGDTLAEYGPRAHTPTGAVVAPFSPGASAGSSDTEKIKWMHRLKDLEGKLRAEREGRLLDRSEASRKIVTLEEVALQAQAREAKMERKKRLEAALSAAPPGTRAEGGGDGGGVAGEKGKRSVSGATGGVGGGGAAI